MLFPVAALRLVWGVLWVRPPALPRQVHLAAERPWRDGRGRWTGIPLIPVPWTGISLVVIPRRHVSLLQERAHAFVLHVHHGPRVGGMSVVIGTALSLVAFPSPPLPSVGVSVPLPASWGWPLSPSPLPSWQGPVICRAIVHCCCSQVLVGVVNAAPLTLAGPAERAAGESILLLLYHVQRGVYIVMNLSPLPFLLENLTAPRFQGGVWKLGVLVTRGGHGGLAGCGLVGADGVDVLSGGQS